MTYITNSLKKYMLLRVATEVANSMLTVAVGYEIYQLTHSYFMLGLVGLVQFFPRLLLVFHSGTFSDQFDRRRIIEITQSILFVLTFILGAASFFKFMSPTLLLIAVFIYGAVFTMEDTAIASLLPNIVQREHFAQATALNQSFDKVASLGAPILAGALYVFGSDLVYWSITILNTIAVIATFSIKDADIIYPQVKTKIDSAVRATLEGFKYIWTNKGLFGAISLDMFAVLFGGITALLPVYASDVFHTGSTGFGILRAAPGIGAVLMSIYLAKKPLEHAAGKKMFAAVALFGLVTILFGLNTNFILGIILLIILGAADQISVVVRSTYVQMRTADAMRGRVTTVNQVFIGTSNQLGEFESGLTSAWWGLIPATIVGGFATIAVVAIWYLSFRDLRELEQV
jgi:MFS family permease